MSAPFQFKQFTITQDQCAMKVGTDGVLLGAWADVAGTKTILDIGTGTGLIALMMAQRSAATIDAIDIDEDAVTQAENNVAQSPWANRIIVYHASIQQFIPEQLYDLIVSNPPFFENSLKSNDASRNLARHNDSLGFIELIFSANNYLKENGKFCIVLPTEEAQQFIQMARTQRLYCNKICYVHPTPEKPAKRYLMQFEKKKGKLEEEQLVIEANGRHQYSEAYQQLTGAFYLNF